MNEIALALSYPPTSNHNTMVAHGRRIASPKYRAWRQLAEREARGAADGRTIDSAYEIFYVAQRPDRRRRDVENLPKSISDALQAAGVIADDANCQRSTIEWASGPPAGKDALVLVRIVAA
jgi:crossover junction endodeoxyribonuclease RusA